MNSAICRFFSGMSIKSIFDRTVAFIALLIMLPILMVAALGIKITSAGPVIYKARRVGRGGSTFLMLKLRTMHVGVDKYGAITAPGDNRIFGFGLWLRRLKIDEVLQFWNILAGDMSLVGPRPEDPKIVERYYTGWMRETLIVLPGVTGPGSIYGYIYGDKLLDNLDPEGSYTCNLLPPKLALDRAYIERADFFGDLYYILLTIVAIIASIYDRNVCLPRVDTDAARLWAPNGPYP